MKKTLLALLGLVMALPTMAQRGIYLSPNYYNDHTVYYGLRLGLSLATVNSDERELDGGGVQAGLNIGAVIGFQLSPAAPVYLETGLFYVEKGGKGYHDVLGTSGNVTGSAKFTYDLNYLQMPIVAKYKYELDDDLSLQPFFGGYLAVGVGGRIKNWGERQSNSSFSSENFKRFDGGLRLGCGIEYQMLYAEMAYDFGLANICHSDWDSSHTGCFYINAGVNF